MLDKKLMNRGFEFKIIKLKKGEGHKWSKEDYQECVELAIKGLPDNSFIQEIAIQSEIEYYGHIPMKDSSTLTVTIYWLSKKHRDVPFSG